MKREILDHLPEDDDEEDGEVDDQFEGGDIVDSELHVNGHTENGNDDLHREKPFSVDE